MALYSLLLAQFFQWNKDLFIWKFLFVTCQCACSEIMTCFADKQLDDKQFWRGLTLPFGCVDVKSWHDHIPAWAFVDINTDKMVKLRGCKILSYELSNSTTPLTSVEQKICIMSLDFVLGNAGWSPEPTIQPLVSAVWSFHSAYFTEQDENLRNSARHIRIQDKIIHAEILLSWLVSVVVKKHELSLTKMDYCIITQNFI